MKNFLIILFFISFICSSSYAQRILLSQGFENGPYTADSLPLRWAKVKVNGPGSCPNADWRVKDSGTVFCNTNPIPPYTAKAFNTRKALTIPWTTTTGSVADDWVFTDSLRIATGDSLIFWVQLGTWPAGGTYYLDSLQIWVTSGQTPASQIARLETVTSLAQATNFWQQKKYNLSAYNGQRIYIAFRYYMNVSVDGIMANVDSVMVRNLSSGGGPVSCTYGWANQTSTTTAGFFSVNAVSNTIGWASAAGAVVRKTIDGITWTNGNPTTPSVITGDVYNICGIDANTALCTTSPAATFIYRTSNGGTTWTQVFTQTGTGAFIDAIKMVDANTGYAMGDPVGGVWTFLKTTNGGINWAQQTGAPTAPAGEAGWNNSFEVEGNNIWWPTNAATGKIYRSTNAGVSFTSVNLGVSTATYASIKFDPNGLVGIATSSTGAAFRSTDGGATWTAITAVPGTGTSAGVETGRNGTNVDFYAVRGTGVQRSTNSGTTWTQVHTAAGTLADIFFAISSVGCPVGWTAGSAGSISKNSILTGVNPVSLEIPTSYELSQNFPNPFNPTTNINFSVPKSGLVTIKVFDMLGKEVATIVNEFKNAGYYIVGFNGSNLSSGAYYYRITSGEFVDTKKMLLIK